MKISKSFLGKICIAAGFILISQFSFATNPVPIPIDDSPTPPPGLPNSMTIEPSASATISDTELAVYFDYSVGDATITVYNGSNQVVCQETVDTNSTTEVDIPVVAWDSGTYMITVTYGTTTQRGSFQI
ncbi:MAG: DUF3244 domain-containing protein [Paludibacter sp.]